MRWIWIDTFVSFHSGRHASAVKNVTLSEEHLHDFVSGASILPPTLMIEGMAQTAGILVGEARNFVDNVILAKIRRADFTDYAGPGDRLQYDATLESIDDRAAVTGGVVRKNGTEIGRVDLIFSHLRPGASPDLPGHNFVFTDRFMDLLSGFRAGSEKGEDSNAS